MLSKLIPFVLVHVYERYKSRAIPNVYGEVGLALLLVWYMACDGIMVFVCITKISDTVFISMNINNN